MSKSKNYIRLLLLVTILNVNLYHIIAQSDSIRDNNNILHYNIAYAGELQFGMMEKPNHQAKNVNLLQLEASLSTDKWWKNGTFEASFWSVASTKRQASIEDCLTFSNIDAPNIWLTCNKLGYQHKFKNISLFVGIRNVNTDYFTSSLSSLFTNSSAGIFPSISLNYATANYPLGGFGIHTKYNINHLEIKNSFYNNLADINSKIVFKFQFNLPKYGYVNFSQIKYSTSDGVYAVGMVLDKLPKLSPKHSLFALIEQPIYKMKETSLGVIAQIGYAPEKTNYCQTYYGGGIVASGLFAPEGKDKLGIIAFHAHMQDNKEMAIELTYKYNLTPSISFQPAIHYINNNNHKGLIGLIRAYYSFGN